MHISTLFRGCAVAAVALMASTAFAQKVITTTKTGELATLIPAAERTNVPSLTVVGPLNGEDLRVIREMCGRKVDGTASEGTTSTLDLSKAIIKQEAGKNYLVVKRGLSTLSIGPSKDNEIGNRLFNNCKPLTKVILPETTVEIGVDAFNGSGVSEVEFPTTVTTIRTRAFASTQLQEVTLPIHLTTLENQAFQSCVNLSKVIFLSQVPPTIPAGLFDKSNNLTYIEVPENRALDYKNALGAIADRVLIQTSVKKVSTADDAHVVARYDAQGRRISAPVAGLNILRLSNGKTVKVLVK